MDSTSILCTTYKSFGVVVFEKIFKISANQKQEFIIVAMLFCQIKNKSYKSFELSEKILKWVQLNAEWAIFQLGDGENN